MIRLKPRVPIDYGYIGYYTQILSNEHLLKLLDEKNWQNLQPGHVGDYGSIDLDIRSVMGRALPFSETPEDLWTNLEIGINEINSSYIKADIDSIVEPIQLMKYTSETKGKYDLHIDLTTARNGIPRKLSVIILLSDRSDFEGGDLLIQVGDQEINLEQEQNKAWIFPSWLPHRVTEVTKGIRKTAVIWVSGPNWR